MNSLGLNRNVLLILGLSAATWLAFTAGANAACEIFSVPQRFNTQTVEAPVSGEETSEEIVVIGAQPERRYRVVMLSANRDTLISIRDCVLDAIITRSRFGDYILVGSFDRRDDAELISRLLREAGYPARVTFQR